MFYPDDGGAIRCSLLDGGVVGGAVGEDGFVIVDVGNEDDDDGRRRVRRSVSAAASAVIDGRYVEFVLVAIQVDGAVVQSDDTGQLFDDELTRAGATADEAEADVVTVFIRCYHRCHQSVGSGVLVHVGCVHALFHKFQNSTAFLLDVPSVHRMPPLIFLILDLLLDT